MQRREMDTGFHFGEAMADGLILKYDEVLIPAACDDDLWGVVDCSDGRSQLDVWEGEGDGKIAIIPGHNGIIEWSLRHVLENGVGDSQSYVYRGSLFWELAMVEKFRDFLIASGIKLEAKVAAEWRPRSDLDAGGLGTGGIEQSEH